MSSSAQLASSDATTPGPSLEPITEAPVLLPLGGLAESAAAPNASDEPVLQLDRIQGNIIPGFNKNFGLLTFLRMPKSRRSRRMAPLCDDRAWAPLR